MWNASVILVVVLSAVSFFHSNEGFFLGWVDFWKLQPLNRYSLVIVGYVGFDGLTEVAGV